MARGAHSGVAGSRALIRLILGTAHISVFCHLLSLHPVGFIGHGVDAGRIHPAIVEVEQSANRNRIVNGFVGPAMLVQLDDVLAADAGGVTIGLIDKPQQRLFGGGQRSGIEVIQDGRDEVFSQQFRRNCGVRLDSKRALVARRYERCDQLPETRAER